MKYGIFNSGVICRGCETWDEIKMQSKDSYLWLERQTLPHQAFDRSPAALGRFGRWEVVVPHLVPPPLQRACACAGASWGCQGNCRRKCSCRICTVFPRCECAGVSAGSPAGPRRKCTGGSYRASPRCVSSCDASRGWRSVRRSHTGDTSAVWAVCRRLSVLCPPSRSPPHQVAYGNLSESHWCSQTVNRSPCFWLPWTLCST